MFSSKIDHSKYLHQDFESFFEQEGFPYLRLHAAEQSASADEEQILLILHGKRPDLLLLTNKRILHYKLPMSESFIKRLANEGVGEVVGLIPGVGELMDGVDNFKELKKGAMGFGGWISGGKRKERKRREALGLPVKKDYKDVKYNLNKPDELCLITGYSDHILLANGFEWKCKNSLQIGQEHPAVSINTTTTAWTFSQAKARFTFKLGTYEDHIQSAVRHAFLTFQNLSKDTRLNLIF